MKPFGVGIIETIILPEAHAINKSITQTTQDDKHISKSIKRFFTWLYDLIDMLKKNPKKFFHYNGEEMSLVSIYNRNKRDTENQDICSLL